MGQARQVKQILVTTKNEAGMLEQVCNPIAAANVNITAICAWTEDGKAQFALLTNNNKKAVEALKAREFQVSEEDVVTITLGDKVGAAAEVSKKIKAAGIDLTCVYGTTCGCKDTSAVLVFGTKDCAKLASCLNG